MAGFKVGYMGLSIQGPNLAQDGSTRAQHRVHMGSLRGGGSAIPTTLAQLYPLSFGLAVPTDLAQFYRQCSWGGLGLLEHNAHWGGVGWGMGWGVLPFTST